MRTLLVLLAGLALVSVHALAQSSTSGTISGTVADTSGAVIPAASVEAVNTETGATVSQTTNASGQYVFVNLRPGLYRVNVKVTGFRPSSVPNVQVEVNKTATLDVKMEVGTDNQVIEVTAAATAQLQTTDAQIGNVISKEVITKLPTLQRNVTELANLQPGVVPTGANLGFRATGAIDDQNTATLDGIDITQVSVAAGTTIPTPQDSVEEFRVSVSNPNANLTRASGGQMTLVGRRGSNVMHASGYGFFQNSALNSNTWDNNAARVAKPSIDDKRYGGRWGGAIRKDKTFLFTNYEARDFDQVQQVQRTVPTDSLKAGILRFRDAAGNVNSWDLRTANNCGDGTQACDPRGLGMSPAVRAQLALMPASNLNSGGDGLNTLAYLLNVPTPIQDRYVVGRLDHNFSDKLSFNGSYTYFRRIQVGVGQVSLKDQASMISTPQRGTMLTGSMTWQTTPTFINVTRFGFVRDVIPTQATAPSAVANLLNIPGTSTSAGNIAMLVGSGVSTFLDSPIDMDTQRARYQATFSRSYQFDHDMTWIKGKHTITGGVQFRPIWFRHDRADKVVGSLTSLVAQVDQASFISVPGTSAPVVCTTAVTAGCIRPGDLNNWNRLYASVLGMVDNVGVLAARDEKLNPLPLGTNLINKTWSYATYLNVQDTWRVTKELTLALGLSWGVQTTPSEELGRQTVQIDTASGQAINPVNYLSQKLTASQGGTIYNPTMGWVPVGQANRSVFNTVKGAFSPRVAMAYSPDKSDGILGHLFGNRKSSIRAGFGLIYDRANLVQNVLIPMLGVGFGQNVSVNGPRCTSGPGCQSGSANPALSSFRVGVDGTIPLPAVAATPVPVVPTNFAEVFSFQVDPFSKLGKSYNLDFSFQRELPGGWIVDVAYVGRFARDLPQAINLNQAPYMFKDPASGQTFAQAYDSIRASLRGGATAASIANQPFFENQLRGIGPSATQYVLARQSANFTSGNVATIFRFLGDYRRSLGLQPYVNDQSQVLFMRTYIGATNYNAGLISVNKRMTKDLLVNFNYTISRALDNGLQNQNNAGFYHNSFDPNVEYGPSIFDRTHVANVNWVYNLPAGRNHRFNIRGLERVLGGWYVSGIVQAWSGLPLIVSDSATSQTWGNGLSLGPASGAIPTTKDIATGLNPSAGGIGYNFFRQGRSAITSFRPVLLSSDGRSGRANPIRGLPYKNLDLSIGKDTKITEKLGARFAADMFNVFNYVNLANPAAGALNLTNPNNFGTINASFIPPNRTNSARWIQLSIRLEF